MPLLPHTRPALSDRTEKTLARAEVVVDPRIVKADDV